MNSVELEKLGITESQYQETNDWLMARMGCVLGSSGRGGSGIFIELKDGNKALLTAKHVLVRVVASGEVSVSSTASESTYSIEPRAIRMHPRMDIAYMIMPKEMLIPAYIPYNNWFAERPVNPNGEQAIFAGAVGEWKSQPNLLNRSIHTTKILQIWTDTEKCLEDPEEVCIAINRENAGLPESFAGMSGGPVIDRTKSLLGIMVRENFRPHPTQVFFIPQKYALDLCTPFVPASDAPTDYEMTPCGIDFYAKDRIGEIEGPILCRLFFEFWKSRKHPDATRGLLCRTTGLLIGNGTRYPINVESIVDIYEESHSQINQLMNLEAEMILNSSNFKRIHLD